VSAAGLGGASVAIFTDQATVGSNTFSTAASFGSACFSDDFNDGTLTGWTQLGSSTLREANGVLTTQAGSNTTTHYSISSGGSWTDYTYSIKVKGVDNDVSGIIFRVQDASNYYLVSQGFGDNDGWMLRLRKVVGGTPTDLVTAINNFGSNPGQVNSRTTFYTFKVVVSGTSIKAYVDDVLKFEITDSTYSGGSAGVWLSSQMDAEFDDAQVLCSGGGAIAFRSASSGSAGSGVLTLSIGKPAGTVQGDVMVASIAVRPETATITPPSGWTLVRRLDNASSVANSLAVYYKVAGASEPSSYSWSLSTSTGSAGGIAAFSGVDTSNPIDIENGQNTPSGLSHATPSISTTVADAMLVASFGFSSSATWTPPTGMTEAYDAASATVPNGAGEAVTAAYATQASAGATGTKTATASNDADVGNAHLLALRPASAPPPAVIAVDNVSSTNSGSANASSLTWAHTVSGSNRYLVVGVSINNENSGTVSGVTYNGQALTSLGTATNGTNARVEMWGMLAPPTGTHNVVVTLSTSQRFTAGAVSFTGVHQTTPLGTLASNTGTSLSASVAASSASGEVVVDVVAKKNSDSTLTVGADQTQRWNEVTTNSTTSNNVVGAASTEPGAASVTMSWFISGGSSRPWAIVAIPLKPAP
jgi:hypothetical protein